MVKVSCGWKQCFSWDYDGFCHAPKAELISVTIGEEQYLTCKGFKDHRPSPSISKGEEKVNG